MTNCDAQKNHCSDFVDEIIHDDAGGDDEADISVCNASHRFLRDVKTSK